MSVSDSVTERAREALPVSPRVTGVLLGAVGVLTFSFSFPATKLALRGFDPWAIAFGRAVLAAALAAPTLRLQRARRPTHRDWSRLAVVAAGVVLGFPVLSTLALESSSSAHGAVVIALLPAATAVAGVLRTREWPSPAFWLAAAVGAAVVVAFALAHAGGALRPADLSLLAGVVVCALGYAEGGLLARDLGAAQTICWALLLALPITLSVALASVPARAPSTTALAGFAYLGVGSMFLGFFAWYGGLARGGVARISQLQLAQTPLTLGWSALVLGEPIGVTTLAVALAVLASVAGTQRAGIHTARGEALP
jgi:drug/metabolite transporter (DMT)-like permease